MHHLTNPRTGGSTGRSFVLTQPGPESPPQRVEFGAGSVASSASGASDDPGVRLRGASHQDRRLLQGRLQPYPLSARNGATPRTAKRLSGVAWPFVNQRGTPAQHVMRIKRGSDS
jgi:hypothetical protein